MSYTTLSSPASPGPLGLPLNARPLPSVRLDDGSRAALAEALRPLPSPYQDIEEFLARLQRPLGELPAAVVRAVRAFAFDPRHPGFLLVQNLPVDPSLPATPSRGSRAVDKLTFQSEGSLLCLARLLGEPFA